MYVSANLLVVETYTECESSMSRNRKLKFKFCLLNIFEENECMDFTSEAIMLLYFFQLFFFSYLLYYLISISSRFHAGLLLQCIFVQLMNLCAFSISNKDIFALRLIVLFCRGHWLLVCLVWIH